MIVAHHMISAKIVSVPLSGLTSVNDIEHLEMIALDRVSVPLSGLTSVNYWLLKDIISIT